MRAGLQSWLERRWYGAVAPAWWLRALAALFAGVVALRLGLYRLGVLRRQRMPCPVIAVGNLAVGGGGKTPLTQALVAGLRARGWKPGIVSRGYGGTEAGPLRLPADPDPNRFGDEPCLLALRTGVPVAVARRRARAARLLVENDEIDVIVADDALQHYALARDVEILAIDARRGHGNGRLLPAGPLREPEARGQRCDFRVRTGGAVLAGEHGLTLVIEQAVRLDGEGTRALASMAGENVRAVAGIADPERFFTALEALGLRVQRHPFPDHHAYVETDFAFDDGMPLLMTEKDAVKCRAFARAHWHAVPLQPELDAALLDALDRRLRAPKDLDR